MKLHIYAIASSFFKILHYYIIKFYVSDRYKHITNIRQGNMSTKAVLIIHLSPKRKRDS